MMDRIQAAEVIDGMAGSLERNPGQFRFEVSVSFVGTQGTAVGGGTGISVSVTGGGPGSSTTGLSSSVSVDNASIEIAQQAADEAICGQIGELVGTLRDIAKELRADKADEDRIRGRLRSLYDTWVPPVITAVVANLVAAATGLVL